MNRWRVSRTTLQCLGCVSFLCGLAIGKRVSVGWLVASLSVLFTPLLFRRNILSVLSISIIGLLLGCWRGHSFAQRLAPYSTYERQKIVIRVEAKTDAVYGQRKQLVFDAQKIEILSPEHLRVPGTVAVGVYGITAVYQGDQLTLEGKLYPTRGGRQAKMTFARVLAVSHDQNVIGEIRRTFASGVQSALPEPHGSFTLGLLVGQRTMLPENLTQQLTTTGLTHIVAVSGYNLTILVQLARRLLQKRSKYQATSMTLGLIMAFVLLCGLSASIVRAALVSVMSLWAWYYGRVFKPELLIVLAAAVTGAWSPTYIWGDIGWYLSFLAFTGILVVAPRIIQRLSTWANTHQLDKPLPALLIETSAALITTTPLILFVFGRLSVVALVTNIAVLPFIPLAMLGGLVAGIAGVATPHLAGWFALPTRLLVTYMLGVVRLFARLPHAVIDIRFSWQQMVVVYGGLIIVGLGWRKNHQNSRIQIRKQE